MSVFKEGLYPTAVRQFRQEVSLYDTGESLSQRERDFHFAMQCNGFFLLQNGGWIHNAASTSGFVEEFKGQRTSFFGPNSNDKFFSGENTGSQHFVAAFGQEEVTNTIRRYRAIDEDQAARVVFLFGGLVRHLTSQGYHTTRIEEIVANSVRFAARMTKLGDDKSGDTIASAIAMYIISGGSIADDKHFVGSVFQMGESVRKDPITPRSTDELGLSQVARLSNFLDHNQQKGERVDFSVAIDRMAFDGFPTVGAEFHFPPGTPDRKDEHPNFWQRLAILNMSQYQRGSYIQMSRNDRDVIEVRMNPSIYPVAIANWNHLRLLLPELNQTYFTVTLNRRGTDFSWRNENDKALLTKLRAIGMLTYAISFNTKPRIENSEEIDFGSVYLGQTVKMHDGKYGFTGNWSGGEGQHGQLGIYAGYGDNYPYLAYFLSMALADPDTIQFLDANFLSRTSRIQDALAVSAKDSSLLFSVIQNRIAVNDRLYEANQAGRRIMAKLNP